MGAGFGLGDRGACVDLEGGVVVDDTVVADDAAVAVVGVLVDAQVGHQHDVVAEVGAQIAQCDLHDAVGVVGAAPDRVLGLRHAEQDHGTHTEVGERGHFVAQRLTGVLDHAGQRGDRLRLVDAFADEQRGDQVGDANVMLCDQFAQGGGSAESSGTNRWGQHLGAGHAAEPNGGTRRRPVRRPATH